MNEKPKVFFSYSETSSADPIAGDMVKRAKAIIGRLGWDIEDPLTEVDRATIGDTVSASVLKSDLFLMFLSENKSEDGDKKECTSPNVAFEAGFAEGIGLPIVIVKRENGGELFADLKGREYIPYPETGDDAAFAEFDKKLSDQLSNLSKKEVSDEGRELQEGLRVILDAIKEQKRKLDPEASNPLHFLKIGWIKDVGRTLTERDQFKVDTHYYPSCLWELRNWSKHKDILAIADVTNGSEFLGSDSENLGLPIKERVFVIDWERLFETSSLSKIHEAIQRHLRYADSEDYTARVVANVPPVLKESNSHPLGEEAKQLDFLIIDDRHVAGYVQESHNGQTRTAFCAKTLKVRQVDPAKRFFTNLVEDAVKVTADSTAVEMRRELRRNHNIGQWSPSWKVPTDRPQKYFDLYDQHIRCWIPGYSKLLDRCMEAVQKNARDLSNRKGRPISVLELGVGTGNLAIRVLGGFRDLNKARLTADERAVANYQAIDSLNPMVEASQDKLAGFQGESFVPGFEVMEKDFWNDAMPEVDLLIGSLVLHQLLNDDADDEKVRRCFERLSHAVVENGRVVFAGILPDSDAVERQRQFDKWKDWMLQEGGIEQEEIDVFFKDNDVLTEAINVEKLGRCASEFGFEQIWHKKSVGEEGSPFGIIVFGKTGSEQSQDSR